MDSLTKSDFPGNIRSLAQDVENAVLLADTNFTLPDKQTDNPNSKSPFERTLCSLKEDHHRHVAYVFTSTNRNRKQTAEILGISVRHVQRILAEMKNDPTWTDIIGKF